MLAFVHHDSHLKGMYRRFLKEEEGFFLALGALIVLPLFLLAAFMVDLGEGWRARAELGAAVRSAALAGAHDLSGDPTALATSAFAAGLAGRRLRDSTISVSVDLALNRIEVVGTARVPLILGGVLGSGPTDLAARAVAIRVATLREDMPWIYHLGY